MTVAAAAVRSTTGAGSAARGVLRVRRPVASQAESSSAMNSALAAGNAARASKLARLDGRSRSIRMFSRILRVARSATGRLIAARGVNRHDDAEMRTRKFAVDELHAAAVGIDELEHHREADAGAFQAAAARRAPGIERIEDVRAIFGRDAR